MEDLLSLTWAWGTTKTSQNIEAQTPSFMLLLDLILGPS